MGSGLSGGQAVSRTSRYARSGPASARYGESTTTSGHARHLPFERLAQAHGARLVVGDVDRPDVVADRARDVDGLDHGPVQARDRDDRALLTVQGAHDEVRPDRQLPGRARYWRLMNSIIPTSIGTRTTTSQAPASNFSTVTTTRTTPVRTAPDALTTIRQCQPDVALAEPVADHADSGSA